MSRDKDLDVTAGLELLQRLRRAGTEIVTGEDLGEIRARTGLPPLPDVRPAQKGEQFDTVVCSAYGLDRPLLLPDNHITECAGCGRQIQHRPNVPAGRRLCMPCALREYCGDA